MSESQRFKEILKIKNFSLSAFAKSIEKRSGHMNRWVKDDALPSGELLKKIMEKHPDINIRYWFLGEGEPLLKGRGGGQYDDAYAEAIKQKELALIEIGADMAELKSLNEKLKGDMKDMKKRETEMLRAMVTLLESKFTGESLSEVRRDFEKITKEIKTKDRGKN